MSHIFIVTLPLIIAIGYLISYNILIITILISAITIFISLYIYNNINVKENLNIIKDDNRVYFYLSDDELFSIPIANGDRLSDILIDTIKREMKTMEDMVDRVDFVNFKDDKLNDKLNRIIKSQNRY